MSEIQGTDVENSAVRLTIGEWLSLRVLANSDVPMTQRDIADESGAAIGTIRNYAVRWRRNGLVTTEFSQRGSRLLITEAGREAASLDINELLAISRQQVGVVRSCGDRPGQPEQVLRELNDRLSVLDER